MQPKTPKREVISVAGVMVLATMLILGCFLLTIAILMVTAP